MKQLGIAALIGLLLGIATSFGQTYIPEPFKQFANSYSVWLLASFIYGYCITVRYRWQVAVGGGLIQIFALTSYYATTNIRFASGTGAASIVLFWLAGGVTAGPLLALGANTGKMSPTIWRVTVTAILLIILSEAGYIFAELHYAGKGFCFLGLAAVCLLILYYCNVTQLPEVAADQDVDERYDGDNQQ